MHPVSRTLDQSSLATYTWVRSTLVAARHRLSSDDLLRRQAGHDLGACPTLRCIDILYPFARRRHRLSGVNQASQIQRRPFDLGDHRTGLKAFDALFSRDRVFIFDASIA